VAGKTKAKLTQTTSPATSLFNLAWPPRTPIDEFQANTGLAVQTCSNWHAIQRSTWQQMAPVEGGAAFEAKFMVPWQARLAEVSTVNMAAKGAGVGSPSPSAAARSFPRWPLPQPDAWAAAVFVDEFDAHSFQGAANSTVVGNRHGGLSLHKLSPSNRRHPYGRCVS
jgi:hypothetical protein